MSKITKIEVTNIANLARIDLTDKEKEKMAKELGSVLEYIDQLQEVDTSKVQADINPHHELINILREDDKLSHEPAENTDKLLKEAPETKDGFIKVKSVFNKDK
ncbi:MAG: Asp-tRNA(Asn)/Glu-tRNA(Gln) amidotransferase GatCAB subunit C [Candidatus Yanofskybacteria bacterium CG10_big_fil_rev_8_21_14_0_10_36_16]|uniref:Aspartyl/glutamyl-tRNA(Asn/Gln) amidotransferase subunit C n=1 Tax=Candidatus Yanofskybacteria bacterium CG10_big_fil_rev_8_21_14_0_10_36_16 TaxID=1975096 RepID=A0A2J0Q6Q4_9BACT|nr:MAG: Asp-tRNA(Asn)/Glu-tRNA(Gln) amidotransferase GatCAB subunit C [Candidatus Yanofskybacteria bacterium CG10_big_fil_rev_8_21_14_0_10_36_16]